MMKSFGLLAILILAFISGMYLTKPPVCGAKCERRIETVDAKEFEKQTKEKDIKIVDVRTPEEYKSGHIKGAINIDINDKNAFETFLGSQDKESKYLVYCRSGNRSAQALKLMEERGFTSITNLDGGVLGWSDDFGLVK